LQCESILAKAFLLLEKETGDVNGNQLGDD